MNKKILIGSIIAVALLTLVSFTSVVGYQSVKNTQEEIITSEYDFEYCKDYLFETFVEISNNEDVKDLINSNNQNLLPTNSNHRLLMPFRRNTNKLSVEHLDFLYNIGLKMIDRLGEEKVLELIKSVKIANPEVYEELDAILMSNEELSERIFTLNEMNAKSEEFVWGFPIICGILLIIFVIPFVILGVFAKLIGFTSEPVFSIMLVFVTTAFGIIFTLMFPILLLIVVLDCVDVDFPDVPI